VNVGYDVAKKWAYLVALGMPHWDSQRAIDAISTWRGIGII